MKRAIFLHGYYAKEKYYNPDTPLINYKDYVPWLLKQLSIRDYIVDTPLMPRPYCPVYEDWKQEFEHCKVDEETVLIGQSFGGGFLVRYLSENNIKVGKVFLVAPYLYTGVDDMDSEFKQTFFDFDIDKDLYKKTDGLTVFQSTNDVHSIKESLELISKSISGFKLIELEDRGHFTISSGGKINETFPELLEEIIGG